MQTSLRDPYIGQGNGAADHVRDEPDFVQVGHALGKHPIGSFKVTARPGCKP